MRQATRLLQSYHKLSNKSILRFFVNAKEALGLKSTNAYERLKKELYEIIDNYNPNFTSEYEKLGFREVEQEASGNATKPSRYEISQAEQEELKEHFSFKNKKSLIREIRENEIAHALKSHGDEAKEAQRGNVAITRDDIYENYPKITKEYDEKFFTDKSVIYVKQVNGHHIGIEEALIGQDKMIFKSLWKTKGNYNREVLLKNAKATPYPHNADEAVKTKSISNPSLEQGYPQQSALTEQIIPQEAQKEIQNIQEKFNFNPQKAKDLQEWHKDSHPITKEVKQEAFTKAEKEQRGIHKDLLESGESMQQGKKVDIELSEIFLDSKGRVDLSKVKATALPKAEFNNTKQFKNLFEDKQGKYGIVKTPYKDIKVDMGYAYRHFYENTYNKNRNYMKGAFFDVLQKHYVCYRARE